ncbi:MAG: EFR1 family ferrodoxin [Clostridia bacterium]|nr:EFR1 family ferrodoxin [Clostridia bacterium]
MKVILVYFSPNTTTQKISGELAALFRKDQHEVLELNIGARENRDFQKIDLGIFNDADLIGIGSPVYHMRMMHTLTSFLEFSLPKICSKNKKAKSFMYLTYAGITTGKAFINTAKLFKALDIPIIGAFKVKAPHFWHLDGYPDQEAIGTINQFYSKMSQNGFRKISWDKIEKMFTCQKTLVKLIYPLVGVIGKVRELPIDIDKQKCIKCKKCVNECPVNAMEMDVYPVRNKKKCIYCYHCTTLCPKNAVVFDVSKIEGMAAMNIKVIGEEQPQNQIFI